MSQTGTNHEPSARQIVARLIAGVLMIGTLVIFVNRAVLASAKEAAGPELWSMLTARSAGERIATVRGVLPSLVEEEPHLALAFGSSNMVLGFSPQAFDENTETRTYNVSTWDQPPVVGWMVAQHARRALERRGRKLELAVVGLAPYQLTTASARWAASEEGEGYGQIVELASPRLLLATVKSPMSADAVLRRFAYGVEYPALRGMLRDGPFMAPAFWPIPDPPLDERWRVLIDYLGQTGTPYQAWERSTRGEVVVRPKDPAKLEALERFISTNQIATDDFVVATDAKELRFGAQEIDTFIETLTTLRAVSRRVAVVVLPVGPASRPSPAGRARLAQLISDIERRSGVKVVSHYEDEAFPVESFRDSHHLNDDGRRRISQAFAAALRAEN